MIDANIIFDFTAGRRLNDLFRLPLLFCTPDLLLTELKQPPASQLVQLGLVIQPLSGEQLREIIALRSKYPALSLPDVATLVLARSLQIGLLTGERRLRELAQASGVEVHGTLWLLEALLQHKIFTLAQACTALAAMLNSGSRLPQHDVANLRRRWGCASIMPVS